MSSEEDLSIVVHSVEEDRIVYSVDSSTEGPGEKSEMIGNGIVQMIVGEGIIALITKALNKEDGYAIDESLLRTEGEGQGSTTDGSEGEG